MFNLDQKLANWLSILLGPHTWLPLLFLILIFKTNLSQQELKIILPTVLIFQVIIPLLYLILAPKLNWVEKWDMEKTEERKPFLFLLIILSLLTSTIICFFGNLLLLKLNITLLSLILVLSIITLFWKVSLHVSINTASAIIINYLYNWELPWLYIIIPLTFWSRLKLKKHSLNQLLAGFALTTLIILIGLSLL
jgi:hypothetical protein